MAHGENNAPRGNAVHPNELPPVERPAAPNTGNAKQDQKYQKQQEKLVAQQNKERQKLQQQQEKEHQQLAKQNATRKESNRWSSATSNRPNNCSNVTPSKCSRCNSGNNLTPRDAHLGDNLDRLS